MSTKIHLPETKARGAASRRGAPAYLSAPLDPQERSRLLMEQLPQVRYIARRIHDRLPRHVPIEDLINAGIVGLLEALDRYDPGAHVQLKSYAKFRIRGAILDSLRDVDWSPRGLRQKARQLENAEQRLRARFGRAPSESELAAEMGLSLISLQQLLGDLRGLDLNSLHGRGNADGESPHTEESVAATGPDPFAQCLEGEMKGLLATAIGELPPRERQILSLYYHEELTLKEVGAVLGIGESRVSQIHTAAIIRLRARMRELLEQPAPRPSHNSSAPPPPPLAAAASPPEGPWKKS